MAIDADFDKVALLLHGDGADGSTTFTDSSQTPKTVSVASGAPRISTAQSKFGGASVHTNGGSIKTTISPLALRDFTVEFFVLRVTGADRALFDIGNNQLLLLLGSAGLRLYDGVTIISSTTMLSTSFMEHVALVRQSGAFKLFHQGVLLGSTTKAINLANGLFTLGGWNAYAPENLNGYFDEVRITDGVARYTANFNPPTEAFPNTSSAYALSGTVTGSTGSPAARAIRAQREDTGAYVGGTISNATTGAYTIPTEYPGEHTVVAYPVMGENLPALVHHGVIPI